MTIYCLFSARVFTRTSFHDENIFTVLISDPRRPARSLCDNIPGYSRGQKCRSMYSLYGEAMEALVFEERSSSFRRKKSFKIVSPWLRTTRIFSKRKSRSWRSVKGRRRIFWFFAGRWKQSLDARKKKNCVRVKHSWNKPELWGRESLCLLS